MRSEAITLTLDDFKGWRMSPPQLKRYALDDSSGSKTIRF